MNLAQKILLRITHACRPTSHLMVSLHALPLNKKGMSLHVTCNSIHLPCNLFMCLATPCICPATLVCNISETKYPPKKWISIMHLPSKYFDFYLATSHVFRNHCTADLYIYALYTCSQLWSALQYMTPSLWFHVLTTSDCINPNDHATAVLWAPRSQVQFMRSTPSQWILPKKFFLGLLMHVAPPLT